MTTRAQQKETTRRAIMDAALRLSAKVGFAGLSLRAVAAEAGLAPATFYRHFESVEDLGLALVDQIGMTLRQLVRDARHRVEDGERRRDVVELSVDTFLEYARSQPNLFRLLAGEGAGNTRELRRAVVKEIARFADDLAEYLELEAQAEGRPLAHVRLAAEAMVTVAFDLGVASLDLRADERRAARERIVLEVRMILRGAQAMAQDQTGPTLAEVAWSGSSWPLDAAEPAETARTDVGAPRLPGSHGPRAEFEPGAPVGGGFRFASGSSCSDSGTREVKMSSPRPHSETLLEILRARASEAPARQAFSYLEDGESRESVLDYGELDRRARALAAHLQRSHAIGDRVLLLYPPGLDFVTAFYACAYAGVTAVPAYPPDPTRLDRTLPRVQAILADCGAATVLTTAAIKTMAGFLFPGGSALAELTWLASDQLQQGDAGGWREPAIDADTVAFLQYTSGSTGSPKGVVITHGNVLVNQEMNRLVSGSSEQTIVLSWVPFYHDLGLIGGVVHPVYVGGRSVLMSPMDFLQKPARWLRAITRHRATYSAGPNFAFELCARRIPVAEREGLDLSSWQMALVGAEPISAATLERFAREFAPWGFDPAAYFQGYGLAEAVLSVSSGQMGAAHRTVLLDKRDLRRNVVTVADGERGGRTDLVEIVSCGRPLPGQDLRVVDPDTRLRRGERELGEVWVRGGNVARGYWNREEESAQTFGGMLRTGAGVDATEEGPFLRTGDLGFFHDGELYVTGRVKDLIILRGRNLYPQDIEACVERAHPALRPGCGAAFSIQVAAGEALVVVQEIRKDAGDAAADVIAAIRRALLREEALRCHGVVLLRAGSIPKTSSGKIRRSACREAFLDGTLEVVARDLQEIDEAASPLLTSEQLFAYPPEARRPALVESLRGALAEVLKVPVAAIDMTVPLSESGVDSIAIMNLAHDIEARLGVELDFDLLLGGASPEAIAGHILDEATGVLTPA